MAAYTDATQDSMLSMDPLDRLDNFAVQLLYYTQERKSLNSKDLKEINEILKSLVEYCKGLGAVAGTASDNKDAAMDSQKFRNSIPQSVFRDFALLVDHWYLNVDLSSPLIHELFCNLLRFGRNAAVTCKRNQDIMGDTGLTWIPVLILQDQTEESEKKGTPPSETELVLIRLALQMLCNCIVYNETVTKQLVMEYHFFETILTIVESFEDERTLQCVATLAYAINEQLGYGDDVNMTMTDRLGVLDLILEKMDRDVREFKLWFTALASSETFVPTIYEELNQKTRVKLLQSIAKHEVKLHTEAITYLRDRFKELSKEVVTCQPGQAENLITDELASLLNLLSLLPTQSDSDDSMVRILKLQNDPSFVNSVHQLLKAVHQIGKQAKNSLTPLEKIEDVVNSRSDEEIQNSPTYLFKSNLIRLIGTLAYNHKPNQIAALKMETLPIILDCTKIDGRNPFAPQCATFAISILLKNNQETQNYVAKMNQISEKRPT